MKNYLKTNCRLSAIGLFFILALISLLNMPAISLAYTYSEAQTVYDQVYNGLVNGTVNSRDLGNEGGPTSPVDPMIKQIGRVRDACLSPCHDDGCRTPCNSLWNLKYNEIYTARNDAEDAWQAWKAGQQQQQQVQQQQQQVDQQQQQENNEAVRQLMLQQQQEQENPALDIIPSATVNDAPLALLGGGGLQGEVGTTVNQSFSASGGLPPYYFTLGTGVGFQPFGLLLDANGNLSGTPRAAGNSTFNVCVVDTAGTSDCRNVTMAISRKQIAPILEKQNQAAVVHNVIPEAIDAQGKAIPAQDLQNSWEKKVSQAKVEFPLILGEGQTATIDTPHGLPIKQLTLTASQAITGQTTLEVLDAARGGHPLETAGIKPPDPQRYDLSYYLKIDTKEQGVETHPFKEAIINFGIPDVLLPVHEKNLPADRIIMMRYVEAKKQWIELDMEPQPKTVPCEFSFCGYAYSPGTSFFALAIKKPTVNVTGRAVKYESLKPGQVVAVGDNWPIGIEYKDGSHIYLDQGAALRFIGPNEYRMLTGKFYVIIGKLLAGKKFATAQATFTAAKTEHTEMWMNVSGNETVVQVSAFPSLSVAATDAKKKTVKVSGGEQLTATATGLGKKKSFDAKKVDTWYATIAPSSSFFDESWKKTSASSAYRQECKTVFSAATAIQTLTADEQASLDAINAALSKASIKEVRAIDMAGKKLYALTEKISTNGKKSAALYINAKNIYYPGAKANSWKSYADAKAISSSFASASKDSLTSGMDKASFKFYSWTNDLTRIANYTGFLTSDGTIGLIKDLTGADVEQGQLVATKSLQIDDETKLPIKSSTTLNIISGKLSIPTTQSCTISYGTAAKITMPSKAPAVSAKIGNDELGKLFQSVQ